QHPFAADAGFGVEADQPLATFDHRLAVEGQPCIDFGGNTARYQLEHLLADRYREEIAGQSDIALAARHRRVQMLRIAGHAGGLEQQRRVGGGIDELEPGAGVQLAGVGGDGGDLPEWFPLGSHESALSSESHDLTRASLPAQRVKGTGADRDRNRNCARCSLARSKCFWLGAPCIRRIPFSPAWLSTRGSRSAESES